MKTGNALEFRCAHLGGCEVVSECDVSGEGEDGDKDWSGGPEVDTESIQVLATSQALQLKLPVRGFYNICIRMYIEGLLIMYTRFGTYMRRFSGKSIMYVCIIMYIPDLKNL